MFPVPSRDISLEYNAAKVGRSKGKSRENQTRYPAPCGLIIYRFCLLEQFATDGSLKEPSRQVEVFCPASPVPIPKGIRSCRKPRGYQMVPVRSAEATTRIMGPDRSSTKTAPVGVMESIVMEEVVITQLPDQLGPHPQTAQPPHPLK